jgi:glutamate-1-semialdehyde 2,1-aminomutase
MGAFGKVISGFRFRAGDTGALYGIQPYLTTFGKIAGGGMPVAVVARNCSPGAPGWVD